MTYASQSLESDLQEIVLRQDFDGGELLCREATCMGDWILLSALQRTEAGQLHPLSGKPIHTRTDDHPWKISLVEGTASGAAAGEAAVKTEQIPEETIADIRQSLAYRYPWLAATTAPSKRTATDRKGRMKDAEAAEKAPEARNIRRKWRQPTFVTQGLSGTEYGTAMHTVLQYIAYEHCGSPEEIAGEICRLTEIGCLTKPQADCLDPETIAGFFRSELGIKLRSGVPHLREFKFSLLDEGTQYDPALAGEQVLLQGVVDCALLEEDCITVIDFKTDNVSETYLPETVDRYRPQVLTYAEALEKIYEKPVKASYLYFFRLNRFVKV